MSTRRLSLDLFVVDPRLLPRWIKIHVVQTKVQVGRKYTGASLHSLSNHYRVTNVDTQANRHALRSIPLRKQRLDVSLSTRLTHAELHACTHAYGHAAVGPTKYAILCSGILPITFSSRARSSARKWNTANSSRETHW